MNICEHLTATAKIFPSRTAIRFEGTSITYAQLDELSKTAANVIVEAGVKPGDRVAIMLANVPAFAVWYYAAARIGAVAVSISTRSAPSEVAYFVGDCDPKFFVSDEVTLAGVGDKLPSQVQAFNTNDFGECQFDGLPGPAQASTNLAVLEGGPAFEADPNAPAAILYTSGTTGFAKGATLSHMNVCSNVHAFNHLCNQRPEDVILLAVPLFHCFGQNALLNSALNVGATLVLQRKFDLNESKRLIAEENVSQLYGVPMMFQLFLDSCEPSDLSSIGYCFSAAATLPVQVGERWQQKFGMPIHEGYGLTETSPFASYNHRNRFVSGSIGTPIDCVEMKVVDTESGEVCQPGEPGEIIIRGPNVMLGYWNRAEETAAAIKDGWFYSGDIGRVDDNGFFYIVDRVKDMIAVGGLKVFPAEVERVLLDHSAVAQAAVVGIPDDVFGEQVAAFVVSDPLLTPEQIQSVSQHAKANLAHYKVPRLIVPINELPRNPSGKILKRQLREYDLTGVAQLPSSIQKTETANNRSALQIREPSLKPMLDVAYAANRGQVATEFVQGLVRTIADLDEAPLPEMRFLDAGLDSLMIVEISNQIQVELGPKHEIPSTLVFDYPRICDLANYLVSVLFSSEPAVKTEALPQSSPVNLRDEVESLSEDEALAQLMKELE